MSTTRARARHFFAILAAHYIQLQLEVGSEVEVASEYEHEHEPLDESGSIYAKQVE